MATYRRFKKLAENWKGKNGLGSQAKFNNRIAKLINNMQGTGNVDVILENGAILINGKAGVGGKISLPWQPSIIDAEELTFKFKVGSINGNLPDYDSEVITKDTEYTLGSGDVIGFIKYDVDANTYEYLTSDALPADDLENELYYFAIHFFGYAEGELVSITALKNFHLSTVTLCDKIVKTFPAG